MIIAKPPTSTLHDQDIYLSLLSLCSLVVLIDGWCEDSRPLQDQEDHDPVAWVPWRQQEHVQDQLISSLAIQLLPIPISSNTHVQEQASSSKLNSHKMATFHHTSQRTITCIMSS